MRSAPHPAPLWDAALTPIVFATDPNVPSKQSKFIYSSLMVLICRKDPVVVNELFFVP